MTLSKSSLAFFFPFFFLKSRGGIKLSKEEQGSGHSKHESISVMIGPQRDQNTHSLLRTEYCKESGAESNTDLLPADFRCPVLVG